jgi:hypothetical protein
MVVPVACTFGKLECDTRAATSSDQPISGWPRTGSLLPHQRS